MKGTHLLRVTKTSGGFPLPLEGVSAETLLLESPILVEGEAEFLYICLEQEVVFDMGLDFVHLRPLEAFTVSGVHKISPIATHKTPPTSKAILLRIGKNPSAKF